MTSSPTPHDTLSDLLQIVVKLVVVLIRDEVRAA
jgi:hypothetical protein